MFLYFCRQVDLRCETLWEVTHSTLSWIYFFMEFLILSFEHLVSLQPKNGKYFNTLPFTKTFESDETYNFLLEEE